VDIAKSKKLFMFCMILILLSSFASSLRFPVVPAPFIQTTNLSIYYNMTSVYNKTESDALFYPFSNPYGFINTSPDLSKYFTKTETNSTGIIGLNCSNNEILKVNGANGIFECATDSTGSTPTLQAVLTAGDDANGLDIRNVDDMWVDGTFRSGIDGNMFVYDIDDEIHHLGADLQKFDELRSNVFTTPLIITTIHNATGDYINITATDNGKISFISTEAGIAKSDSFDPGSHILELTNGTEEHPMLNRVYAYISGDEPHWGVSLTEPTIPHAQVARILLGDAGELPYAASLQEDGMGGFIKRTQRVFRKMGLLYGDGFDYTATANDLEIGTGSYINGVYDNDFLGTINVTEGFYLVHTDGTYHWYNSFDEILTYSNDASIGNNKYFNVIWGITPYDGTGNIYAVVQDEPNVEYTSTTLAWADSSNTMNIYPNEEFIKYFFIPVARTVIKKGSTAQLLPTGSYAEDYRGGVAGGASSGGGLSEVDPIWTVEKTDYALLTDLLWNKTGTTLTPKDGENILIDSPIIPVTLGTPVVFSGGAGTTDTIVPGILVLDRDASGQWIFNTVSESGVSTPSPADTEWNTQYCGEASGYDNLNDLNSRTYLPFKESLNNGIGEYIIGEEMIMHIISTDQYYKVLFSSWQEGGGGGFAYTRTEIFQMTPSQSLIFDDGVNSEIRLDYEPGNLNFVINDSSAFRVNAIEDLTTFHTDLEATGLLSSDSLILDNDLTIGNKFKYNGTTGVLHLGSGTVAGYTHILTMQGGTITGNMHLVNGVNNIVYGNSNRVSGTSNIITGDFSDASGRSNLMTADYGAIHGYNNANFIYKAFGIGQNSNGAGNSTDDIGTDPAFFIGDGTTYALHNSFIVRKNGNVELNNDNAKLLFGEGQDASIYYTGTNLNINPKSTGSGVVYIEGEVTADGYNEYTFVTNTTDKEAYELVKYATTNFYIDGIKNYTVWGECYNPTPVEDKTRPVETPYIVEECTYEEVCIDILNSKGKIKETICEELEEEVCNNITKYKTEHPYTKLKDTVSLSCKQAMISKADNYERETIKVYDDFVDIDFLGVEELYTRTPKDKRTDEERKEDKIKFKDKIKNNTMRDIEGKLDFTNTTFNLNLMKGNTNYSYDVLKLNEESFITGLETDNKIDELMSCIINNDKVKDIQDCARGIN